MLSSPRPPSEGRAPGPVWRRGTRGGGSLHRCALTGLRLGGSAPLPPPRSWEKTGVPGTEATRGPSNSCHNNFARRETRKPTEFSVYTTGLTTVPATPLGGTHGQVLSTALAAGRRWRSITRHILPGGSENMTPSKHVIHAQLIAFLFLS